MAECYNGDMPKDDRAELLSQVMKLPAGDRLSIASDVLDSVEGTEDSEWSAAWLAELDRRAAAVERGDVELEDWEVAKARIQSDLQSQ